MVKEKKTQEEQSEFAWEGGNTKEEESEFNWEGTSSTNDEKQVKESDQKEKSKSKTPDRVETEENNTNSNSNTPNNQPVGNINGMKIFAFVILMIGIIFVFVIVFFDSDPFGDRAGDAEYAKDKALEYLEGPDTTTSQLQCEPKELIGDLILVKCETTDEFLIKYYGSSTLWYGYLESAGGSKYKQYGSGNREEVINHFNK